MRDPANRLFDSACDLLSAARVLAAELAQRGHEEALPATFGCLEEAFRDLARAHSELAARGAGNDSLTVAIERAGRAMAEAERACSAARVAAGWVALPMSLGTRES